MKKKKRNGQSLRRQACTLSNISIYAGDISSSSFTVNKTNLCDCSKSYK